MKSPQYYIQTLELDIEPNVSDIDFGAVNLEFEVDDVPEYDSDQGFLRFESRIEMDLECYPTPLHNSDKEKEETVGTVETDILILVEGNEDEFESPITTWKDDGYREVDWEFRYHIESGIITEVFSPISNLVNNSFRGILPGVAFTEPPSSEPDELPVDRTEFLRTYLQVNLKEELVSYLRDEVGLEFDEEDIIIDVKELDEVHISAPDEIKNQYDEESVESLISKVYTQIVQQEADEEIELSSVEVETIDTEDE